MGSSIFPAYAGVQERHVKRLLDVHAKALRTFAPHACLRTVLVFPACAGVNLYSSADLKKSSDIPPRARGCKSAALSGS